MVGLSADPMLALRGGAVSSTLLGTVLLFKALRARQTDYRRTELWVLLDRRHDLPEAQAPQELSIDGARVCVPPLTHEGE